ncbi:MAG: FAD:protein transferase [Acidimicrobiaceae bacterium]|nr:FAD:protein transferase [Acidimicrobiaceae bacterium]
MTLLPDLRNGAAGPPVWQRVDHPDAGLAIGERPAIGTTARVATTVPASIAAASAAVDSLLHRLDRVASRFRPDSDLQRLTQLGPGAYLVGPGLRELVEVALEAARWTRGLVDPTVGAALVQAGYDRDFGLVPPESDEALPRSVPAPGWRAVNLLGALLELPAGVQLDLGATAKAFGADRAAAMAAHRADAGVLVSLGGDIALAGAVPDGGWPVVVEEAPDTYPAAPDQHVRLLKGALATSSTTRRRWKRTGQEQHHLIDPRTGSPAAGRWRTATVAAATCVEANAAATAAIIGGEEGLSWLVGTGLAARLVARDGSVVTTQGWPTADGGVPVIASSGMAVPSTPSWEP